MRQRGGKGIRSVKEMGHFLRRDIQDMAQHLCHALLGGGSGTGNRLLDSQWRIFGNRYVAAQSSSHRHTLRPAELKH